MGFLVIILLCMVIIACSQDNNWLRNWESKMPNVHIPELVVRGAPTFTVDEVQKFKDIISNGSLINHATEFCKVGHLLCTEDVQFFKLATSLGGGGYGQASKWRNLFFSRFRTHIFCLRRFTISSSSLPHLQDQLGIPNTSNMWDSLNVKLQQPRARQTCLISFEEMAEFVVGILGQNNILVMSSLDTKGSNQQVTITSIKKFKTTLHPAIACHLYMFPFAFYTCNYILHSLMYELSLKMTDGGILQRLSVCHPGYDCHWVLPNDIMWLLN